MKETLEQPSSGSILASRGGDAITSSSRRRRPTHKRSKATASPPLPTHKRSAPLEETLPTHKRSAPLQFHVLSAGPPLTAVTDNNMVSSADLLFERLQDYHESRGWLSLDDYTHYRQLLRSKNGSSEYVQGEIHRELDLVATRQEQQGHHDSSTVHTEQQQEEEQPDSILYKKSAPRGIHVSWEDQSRVSDVTLSMSAVEKSSLPTAVSSSEDDDDDEEEDCLLEPADLWNGSSCQFSESQLTDLFVEMCFYARLGYVQPPSCLQCTYRESLLSTPQLSAAACKRWVVWRQDAATLLHPARLGGNLLLVQCHAARRLLRGDIVQGRRWDAPTKTVIRGSHQV